MLLRPSGDGFERRRRIRRQLGPDRVDPPQVPRLLGYTRVRAEALIDLRINLLEDVAMNDTTVSRELRHFSPLDARIRWYERDRRGHRPDVFIHDRHTHFDVVLGDVEDHEVSRQSQGSIVGPAHVAQHVGSGVEVVEEMVRDSHTWFRRRHHLAELCWRCVNLRTYVESSFG